MTPDHQARTAADTITTVASKIARWAANVHALDLAPARHYTADRQPGQPTPVSPKVTRPGTSDPTVATVDNADRIVDKVVAHLADAADLLEQSAEWRGHTPAGPGRSTSGFLHPSMATVHADRATQAARWLTGWIGEQWTIAMDLAAGDVRDAHLEHQSVWPAAHTLDDTADALKRVYRRWVRPAPAGGRPVLCVCGCRRVADHGRHHSRCQNAPDRCGECGNRTAVYRSPDRCRPCYKRQRRAS